jgi:hypothetical protein
VIAKAIADYVAEDETQLSLKRGALVSVTYLDTSPGAEWWEGTVSIKGQGKQTGWFPASCVQLMSKAPAQTQGTGTALSTTSSTASTANRGVCTM